MTQLEELQSLLKQKKSRKFYAERMKTTVERVNELFGQLNKSLDIPIEKKGIVGVDENIKDGSMKLSYYSDKPATAEEIIKSHNLDLTKWRLDRFWSLQKGKGFLTSALFVAIKGEEKQANDFLEFFETYKAPKLEFKLRQNEKFYNSCMAEISLADAHIDKAGLEGESMEEFCNKYLQILENLLHRTYAAHHLDEIVFIAGNDLFTSDTFFNQVTSQSNVQEVNARWDVSYEKGFDLMVKAISMCRTFAPKVKVIMINGNHDRTKSFYLAHALEVFFGKEATIEFDRTSKPRKIHVFGNTSLMYHHGNCKQEKLPLIMASEFPEQWGNTKYHRVGTGDKHHQKVIEVEGVIIQQFPSLSQTDTWHNENNFHLSQRVGMLNVYDREKGIIAEYQEKI